MGHRGSPDPIKALARADARSPSSIESSAPLAFVNYDPETGKPLWAPRVRMNNVRHLYQGEARGLLVLCVSPRRFAENHLATLRHNIK